jgi:hypothetical protein
MLEHYGALIELQHLRDEEEAAINREDMNAASARQAPGESTPDFLARAMREDHDFTVPGRSLLAQMWWGARNRGSCAEGCHARCAFMRGR